MVKKGTGKKGGSKYVSTLPPFDFQPPTIADLGYTPPEFIKCRITSVSVASPLSFDWPAVPTDVTLSMIKEAIYKRHGGTVMGLVLYKDQVKPDCVLQAEDDGASLRSLGVKGIVSGNELDLPVVTILYDFTVARPDDTIILVDSNQLQSKHNVDTSLLIAASKARRS